MRRAGGLALAALLVVACRSQPPSADRSRSAPADDTSIETAGESIVACGQAFPIGTPVVLWFEPGGYDAYATQASTVDGPTGLRYHPGRQSANPELAQRIRRGELEALREQVDLFVLHYDACGFSRRCFHVLQDLRGLSVHFLLDLDGTVYQTLDLAEQAWHARQANPRSVGVEIANIGAYTADQLEGVAEWFVETDEGLRIDIPERYGDDGVRASRPYWAPDREGLVEGTIQGTRLAQADFTTAQYQALVKLTAGLARVFPRIELDAPRDAAGEILTRVLDDAEFDAFRGVLGHWHVSKDKLDPGPAFQFERVLREARGGAAPTPW